MRFDPATFTWEGVPPQAYKPIRGTDLAWKGVTRLRYFEVAPGGYTSLERHRHVHAVVVVRGRGVVRVGAEHFEVRPLDVVYVPPGAPHQFLNPDPREPFGFFCPVDAERDAPQPVAGVSRA
jgi:quercetin dioxygenase-like cupin family protein